MKTTKMLAGLVGVAGMLVSGAAKAEWQCTEAGYCTDAAMYPINPDAPLQSVSFDENPMDGHVQYNSCGCNYAQNWNVPEGAAVVGRSNGPFKTIIDVMRENATHVMLYRGKRWENDVPRVVHTSGYMDTLPNTNSDENIDHPIYGDRLAFIKPGASRISVASSYEYFHTLQTVPVHQLRSYQDAWGNVIQYSVPVGYEKRRYAPENFAYAPGVWTEANVCFGNENAPQKLLVHCVPSLGPDGPEERCWNEKNPSEQVICDAEPFVDQSLLERFKAILTNEDGNIVTKFLPETELSIWGALDEGSETQETLLKEIQARHRMHTGDDFEAGRTTLETINGEREVVRVCRRQDQSDQLCYSKRTNLGLEAAKRTDQYPFTVKPGTYLGTTYFTDTSTHALFPFHYSRNRDTGLWETKERVLQPDEYPTPYYLHQYVDLEGGHLGYETPGFACSTFLAFLQVQSARLAAEDAWWSGKPYLWDKRFNAIRPKEYPVDLVRDAAIAVYNKVFYDVRSTGLGPFLGMLNWASGIDGQSILDEIAQNAASQLVNCILFGPVNGRCDNTSLEWLSYINSPDLELLPRISISADWLVGRTSRDEEGRAIGNVNDLDSIWSRSTAIFGYPLLPAVQYSSEGRVCSCW